MLRARLFSLVAIVAAAALAITTGTSPTSYSPTQSVTREQMASFLARFWKTA